MPSKSAHPGWGIVLVRIGLGLLLLWEAKRLFDAGIGPWIVEDCAQRIATAPLFYAWFGQNVVLAMPGVFAWLITGALIAAGSALFLGALVRPASAGVILMMANFHLAGPAHETEYRALVALCALACALANAGTRLGLDTYLARRLSRWLTWSR